MLSSLCDLMWTFVVVSVITEVCRQRGGIVTAGLKLYCLTQEAIYKISTFFFFTGKMLMKVIYLCSFPYFEIVSGLAFADQTFSDIFFPFEQY